MNSLVLHARRLRRFAKEAAAYVQLNTRGNDVLRQTDFTNCPKPVLLLYGFMSTRRTFDVLERRLRRDGYCVWSMRLGGMLDTYNTLGIDDLAERVHDKVEKMYARYQLGPLSIIGHSKGGLIGRYYVKRLGGDARVKTLITLGTPHHGTPVAYLGCATVGALARSVWQMTPMSPFIRRLKLGPFPAGVRFASIYSKGDGFTPFPSALLETSEAEDLHNIEVPDVSHRELLYRRAVYEVIHQQLAAGYGEPAPRLRLQVVPPVTPLAGPRGVPAAR